jgi:hypothetical protein
MNEGGGFDEIRQRSIGWPPKAQYNSGGLSQSDPRNREAFTRFGAGD